MQYIDLHCDTLMQAFIRQDEDIYKLPYTMVDLHRLKEGNAMAQFFAIFLPPAGAEKMIGRPLPEDDEYIKILAYILQHSIEMHPAMSAKALNQKDLKRNREAGKISTFLTLEDGRSINGSLEKLESYVDLGIRLISLTWNAPNCIGYPNSKESQLMLKGLTDFGKEAVLRMEELGILVDVSHLSDGGFYDVAALCKGPFVASHSNCRSLSGHQRNLTDDMIQILAERGGVAGLNFGPGFLNADLQKKESRMEEMIAHIRHMIRYGGEDCVALGTDFDGIQGSLEVSNPAEMPKLFAYLEKEGFTQTQIEKLAYKNVERVIAAVLH